MLGATGNAGRKFYAVLGAPFFQPEIKHLLMLKHLLKIVLKNFRNFFT